MSMTKVESEHDQLISMLKQLVDEREMLSRENEYLKAKLNESMLMETIKELKRERDLLLKLLSNLTIKQNNINEKNIRFDLRSTNIPSSPSHPALNKQNPLDPTRLHRLKTNQTNKKLHVYQTSIRKNEVLLKHSQNSAFQHYRSQSLQDLS